MLFGPTLNALKHFTGLDTVHGANQPQNGFSASYQAQIVPPNMPLGIKPLEKMSYFIKFNLKPKRKFSILYDLNQKSNY